MRIDRRDTEPNSNRIVDTKAMPLQPSSFSVALQQHRHRVTAPDRDPKHAQETRPRRGSSSEVTATNTEPTATKTAVSDASPQPLLSLLSTLGNGGEHAIVASSAPRPPRPRRTLADPESTHCIEVAHPGTGMRFVLSQQDGVWLLSIDEQSTLSAADLQSFLSYLREEFAEKGLGDVDLIGN